MYYMKNINLFFNNLYNNISKLCVITSFLSYLKGKKSQIINRFALINLQTFNLVEPSFVISLGYVAHIFLNF